MRKNGSTKIVLIILVLVFVGIVGYLALVKEPVTSPIDQSQLMESPQDSTTSTTTVDDKSPLSPSTPNSNLKIYKNDKYRFEVKYPPHFVFHDSQSIPDSWTITKLRDGRIIKPIDCGGFLKQPDEISLSWSVFDRQNPEYSIIERYNTSKYVPVSIGDKSLKVQRSIPGMCENSDEFIWMEPSGKYIVTFSVSPFNTTLVDEYKTIIASFRFF